MRIDAYLNAYSGNGADSDFQTPYNIKIMSGGTISRKLSYYLYFFLFERGEIGGIEDAIIMVDDIGGLPLDLAVGQYQVSIPCSSESCACRTRTMPSTGRVSACSQQT
jgi:hypothetical protein